MGMLTDKVAVVTGASRGIGKAIALRFAREGAKVVLAARTENEGGHSLPGSLATSIADIEAAGGNAISIAGDISREEDCQRIVDGAHSAFGPVDILVNNAMWANFAPIAEMAPKRWTLSFAVNVQAPFILSKLVLPDMIPRQGGAIINISSKPPSDPDGDHMAHPRRCGMMLTKFSPTRCTERARPRWSASRRVLPRSCSHMGFR